MQVKLPHMSKAWELFLISLVWLLLISGMHLALNFDWGDRRVLRLGYMPVITNMSAPIMDYASKEGDGVRFQAIKYASFAEMAESLRNREIDAGFMIAPLSVVLRQQGEDVKVVYIGNRHESTLVTRKDLKIKGLEDLVGKTIAVPMRYSGHNLSILQLLEEQRLSGQIKVVEMNPPDMASALAAGSLDAYYVGEPFAAQTVQSGDAEVMHYVEEVWDKFICNLMVVRQDLIDEDREAVTQIVQGAIRSGLWANQNRDQAAEIAARYWNQKVDLVKYALNTPEDRILFDQYTPSESEMQQITDLMLHFNLVKNNDIGELVDDSFAKATDLSGIDGLETILR